MHDQSVGASLGNDSIRSGIYGFAHRVWAGRIGMIIYYKHSGLNAIWCLLGNLIILMGFMGTVGATLTLPGIAGIILIIGMAVDSNILIFERIREELRGGKTVRAAIDTGLQQGILDNFRHPSHNVDLCRFPVSVRHGADPRIRGDVDHRSAGQHVYGNVCLASTV